MRSDWSFGTVANASGTLRVGKDGTIGFGEEDEGEDDEDWDGHHGRADYGGSRRENEDGSEQSVQGSTVRGVVSRSVVVSFSLADADQLIPASHAFQPKGLDVPALLASSPHGSRTDFSEPNTPPTPPVHASSSMKRNSFARRHDINGTVVTEADLGSGYALVHTASQISRHMLKNSRLAAFQHVYSPPCPSCRRRGLSTCFGRLCRHGPREVRVACQRQVCQAFPGGPDDERSGRQGSRRRGRHAGHPAGESRSRRR